jgi:hypothetical protein
MKNDSYGMREMSVEASISSRSLVASISSSPSSSSGEREYVSACLETQEILWLELAQQPKFWLCAIVSEN